MLLLKLKLLGVHLHSPLPTFEHIILPHVFLEGLYRNHVVLHVILQKSDIGVQLLQPLAQMCAVVICPRRRAQHQQQNRRGNAGKRGGCGLRLKISSADVLTHRRKTPLSGAVPSSCDEPLRSSQYHRLRHHVAFSAYRQRNRRAATVAIAGQNAPGNIAGKCAAQRSGEVGA